jgi:hypothetical protein
MRAGRVLAAVVGLVAVFGGAAALASGGVSWGSAVEVPGSATLNAGGNASVDSVSCVSAGNCAAGGYYRVGSSRQQAFVVSEKKGVWGKAIEVPGTAALNVKGHASVNSVACASAGNCSAGGYYSAPSGVLEGEAFVAREKNGVWAKAIEVPGTAALNVKRRAAVESISCVSTGQCAAGGVYTDGSNKRQAFVVDEKRGVWGRAIKVPGTATLNKGGAALVNSVSCGATGDCAAGGSYTDGYGHFQAFVVSEKNGIWTNAVEVPGTNSFNTGDIAQVESVSCVSAGNCAAGGAYRDGFGSVQAFVASEKNGVWGTAVEVPGSATLNKGGAARVLSVSCASTSNCAAGGYYSEGPGHSQAFVVSETNGVWKSAVEVPGSATLNAGGNASVDSVSCVSAGNCAAGGVYTDGFHQNQAFVTVP